MFRCPYAPAAAMAVGVGLYALYMEPDQDRGFCEACGGNTVISALMLAGFI
jgi:hypothetical protein